MADLAEELGENKAVASFDSRVLPSARKFSEMGISTKKEVEQVEQVDKIPRDLTLPEQD